MRPPVTMSSNTSVYSTCAAVTGLRSLSPQEVPDLRTKALIRLPNTQLTSHGLRQPGLADLAAISAYNPAGRPFKLRGSSAAISAGGLSTDVEKTHADS